jgi:hypothetical protein
VGIPAAETEAAVHAFNLPGNVSKVFFGILLDRIVHVRTLL